jgi:hypothetical protein
MPGLLKKDVGADRVLQHIFMKSIPQLSKKEVEVEKCFNCASMKLKSNIQYSINYDILFINRDQ